MTSVLRSLPLQRPSSERVAISHPTGLCSLPFTISLSPALPPRFLPWALHQIRQTVACPSLAHHQCTQTNRPPERDSQSVKAEGLPDCRFEYGDRANGSHSLDSRRGLHIDEHIITAVFCKEALLAISFAQQLSVVDSRFASDLFFSLIKHSHSSALSSLLCSVSIKQHTNYSHFQHEASQEDPSNW